jgi:membrane-associated phospholipid phosphatase
LKKILILTVSILPLLNSYSQEISGNNGINQTAVNIYNGFADAVELYDIPVTFAFLGNKIINQNNIGDQIVIPPSELEIQLASEIAVPGSYSPGSMDKDKLPWAIFFSRMALNVSLNLFTNSNVTSDDYKILFLFQKSLIYTHTLTEIVKNLVKRERPNGYDNRSFFSGHTSTAFAASTFLYLELKDFYRTWSVTRNDDLLNTVFNVSSFGLLYGWAGYVGYSRMRDNKHYLSDVLLGAAAGTAVSYLVYKLYYGEDSSHSSNIGISALGDNISINYTLKF